MGSSSFGGQCLYGSSSGEGEVDGRYSWLNLPGKSPVKIPAGQEITVRY
ncbi:MAG: hypothetical protein LKI87_06145 [Prevotella sp.]|nr:hypothetical protein [Prevotella sp.]MCI1686021.1 hypothetical protein [Prevotella sp.]MCI1803117.1 hypothetical protein [Prevotella sp.]MCI1816933.1 hypothetical protein [Prevotella sp.]MCI1848392.1 hypothetical protein [Prevotella sp.]